MLNALATVSPTLAGSVAFRIFCTPKRLPVREKDREFLATATHSTFRTEGLSIRSYVWESQTPNAQTVLFLHGWESNAARWHKYIKAAIKAGFRVEAFDAPASGYSSGKLLNVLLYSRTVKKHIVENDAPYAIIAHSLGGAAAVMSLALLGAKRPQKMAVLAAFAESTRVLRDFAHILGANESVLQALFRHIERRSGLSVEEYSVRKKAAELKEIEGFVLHDLNDEVAPVSEGLAIAESWECRFLQTEGFGHRMQDKAVVQEVIKFLVSKKSGQTAL
ncbi:MAG: alpha/beta fold hydrolase [Phycisphaerae bacterium]|nr:alpha/beta fold hydrolase [Saprospiraceae bacterium]